MHVKQISKHMANQARIEVMLNKNGKLSSVSPAFGLL